MVGIKRKSKLVLTNGDGLHNALDFIPYLILFFNISFILESFFSNISFSFCSNISSDKIPIESKIL